MSAQWIIRFTVPHSASVFTDTMEPFAEAVSAFERAPGGDWHIEAIGPEPDRGRLGAALALTAAALGVAEPEATIETLPEKDWLAENRRSFRPIHAGRFLVHPSHIRPDAPGRLLLRIDAGEAFGSGEHETTRLCLMALDRLAKRRPRWKSAPGRPAWALDMGCGSGILSLAIALRWRMKVLAVDIAPEAARVTRRNARDNGLAALVRAMRADGYRRRAMRGRRFGLIVSNILQRPLVALAPDLARHLGPAGRAVLSGFYPDQAQAVIAAHRARGLRLECVETLGRWCAATLRKDRSGED